MADKRRYIYADALTSQTGDMICTRCNKPITHGGYRYREGVDRYVSQHRECTWWDPHWKALDKQLSDLQHFMRARELAAKAFVKQWGRYSGLLEVVEDAIKQEAH